MYDKSTVILLIPIPLLKEASVRTSIKILECGELPFKKEISHSCALYCTRTIKVSAESNLLPKSSIFEAIRLFL